MKLGKNYLKILCSTFFCFALGTVGCSNGDPTASSGGDVSSNTSLAQDEFLVTFDTKGGTAVAQQVVKVNNKATKPASDPTQEGYVFTGWYWDFDEVTAFDFENTTIASNTTIYAGWSQDHDYFDNGPGSGGGGGGGGSNFTLYFKDAGWWNKDAAATKIQYNGEGTPTLMTHIKYVEAQGFNYWSVTVPSTATSVIFFRYGGTNNADYWGAKTVSVTLADRGTHDMYDISGSSASWDPALVSGSWATYSA